MALEFLGCVAQVFFIPFFLNIMDSNIKNSFYATVKSKTTNKK